MLSAVAARKARLAQAQSQAPAEPPAPASPAPSQPTPKKSTPAKPSSASQKPPSKRKPSAPAGDPKAPKRKKTQQRKAAPSAQTQARYFAQAQGDAFSTQDDVIAVDESVSESSAASSSAASDSDDAPRPTRAVNGRPAWSPSAPLADSSDEDDEDADEPVVLDVSTPTRTAPAPEVPKVLSTFQPIVDQNVFRLAPTEQFPHRRTVLLLRSSETVALLGAYTLTVVRGAVTLSGVRLVASPTAHHVFAPRSSPLPVVQCLPQKSSAPAAPSAYDLPTSVSAAASTVDAVIVLQELHTGIEGLGRICRTFDGFFAPSRWHRNQQRFDLGLDNVYFLPHQTPDTLPLVVPPTWAASIDVAMPSDDEDAAAQRRVYLVKGPKNAGKSTLARLLLNKLLSRFRRVAYLECDLGQSEFTPGGMVSLNVLEQPVFGPPFTHPSIPFSAHFIGATSPRTSPSHYLDSIQALMQQYEIDVRNAVLDEDGLDDEDGRISSSIPLVVNTMGWTKGLGADIARKVEEIVEPSDIFAFTPTSPEDELAYAGREAGPSSVRNQGPSIYPVESVSPESAASHYTAADHRNLSILSYFHAVFPHNATDPSSPYTSPFPTAWNTALPLCAQPPYEVDWQTAFDELVLTGAGSEDVVPSEVPHALPCTVVALVSCDPGTRSPPSSPSPTSPPPLPLPYNQGAPPPSPYTSRCLGLGLIRGLSPASAPHTRLQLLTPVPAPLLGAARALVMGELQIPVWGLLDFRTLDGAGDVAGCERGRVPYLRWGKGEGAGGERRRVRRNLMRKGQM